MNKLLGIIILIVVASCNQATDNKKLSFENKNSILESATEYDKFISKFIGKKLIPAFDINIKSFQDGTPIKKEYIKKFICLNINYCNNTKESAANLFYSLYKLPSMNPDIDIIIYGKRELPYHRQIIIATYSKKTHKKINELVLWAYDKLDYEIKSTIDTNLNITTTSIYTNFQTVEPLIEGKPYEYFYIDKIINKYKINLNGEIILTEEGQVKEYLSTLKNNEFHYPVSLPKEIKE